MAQKTMIIIDIEPLTLKIKELIYRFRGVQFVVLSDIRKEAEPFVERIAKNRLNDAQELLGEFLEDCDVPDKYTSLLIDKECRRIARLLEPITSRYKRVPYGAVYAHAPSEIDCIILLDEHGDTPSDRHRIEKTPDELFLMQLEEDIKNGDYVPERLRRLLDAKK